MGASIDSTMLGKFLKITSTAVELIHTQVCFLKRGQGIFNQGRLLSRLLCAEYLKIDLLLIEKKSLFKHGMFHFSLKMLKLFSFKTVLNYYE